MGGATISGFFQTHFGQGSKNLVLPTPSKKSAPRHLGISDVLRHFKSEFLWKDMMVSHIFFLG